MYVDYNVRTYNGKQFITYLRFKDDDHRYINVIFPHEYIEKMQYYKLLDEQKECFSNTN